MRVAVPEKMDNDQILNKEKIKITVSKKKKTKGSAFVAIATKYGFHRYSRRNSKA